MARKKTGDQRRRERLRHYRREYARLKTRLREVGFICKELWWSAGCSAVSPTALAPPTVQASTAPIINSPGRKKAKPCRGGYRPSTLRSTGNGSPTVSASSRSFSRCTEFHKRPTATCCRLKKPKKAVLNQGI